jgi:uncharacterized protein (TIGR03067 family)
MIKTLEVEGNELPSLFFSGSKITIDGTHFATSAMGAVYEGELELDVTSTPKRIDMKFSAGPEKGNKSLGIYELDGDKWMLCLTIRGDVRPVEFATKAGSGHALERLERAK